VVALGGGRRRAEDKIDFAVGLGEFLPLGAPVRAGDTLARVHARNIDAAKVAADMVAQAYLLSETPPALSATIHEVIRE
jgi:thymidine phosphorylase